MFYDLNNVAFSYNTKRSFDSALDGLSDVLSKIVINKVMKSSIPQYFIEHLLNAQ